MKTFSKILFMVGCGGLFCVAEADTKTLFWGGLICLLVMAVASELFTLAEKKEAKQNNK